MRCLALVTLVLFAFPASSTVTWVVLTATR